ncbi:I78 family peptidase inhibitor [Vitreimonas flagellata]|uniref:I78 family peptidase inhibitor n=1 Tax=Vitreimonas flagellata TaxID=2560861 RepID=UPI00142FCF5B|nr:I78 family peptidase inhibitor [Vitreimonas flagellata]
MRRVALVSLVTIAACAAQDRPAPQASAPQNAEEATQADRCGATRFIGLIGTPADQIDRASLPAGARVLTPDMMVTADFRGDRLNIIVGSDGKVGSLRCF